MTKQLDWLSTCMYTYTSKQVDKASIHTRPNMSWPCNTHTNKKHVDRVHHKNTSGVDTHPNKL